MAECTHVISEVVGMGGGPCDLCEANETIAKLEREWEISKESFRAMKLLKEIVEQDRDRLKRELELVQGQASSIQGKHSNCGRKEKKLQQENERLWEGTIALKRELEAQRAQEQEWKVAYNSERTDSEMLEQDRDRLQRRVERLGHYVQHDADCHADDPGESQACICGLFALFHADATIAALEQSRDCNAEMCKKLERDLDESNGTIEWERNRAWKIESEMAAVEQDRGRLQAELTDVRQLADRLQESIDRLKRVVERQQKALDRVAIAAEVKESWFCAHRECPGTHPTAMGTSGTVGECTK